jgi:hypothetical protein
MIVRDPTRLVLGALLAIATVFLVLMLLPEGETAGPSPHPRFPAMLVGGDAAAARSILGIGWLFGALQVLLFSALVALGAGRRALQRGLLRPLASWTVIYLFTWTFLLASYRGWIAGASEPSLLGLPLPTVMMLFVLWPLPTFYVVFYVRGFERWVFDDEDAARLREIVRRSGTGDAEHGEGP